MKAPTIWMPVYIGDYLSDTMHLAAEEHGAYFLLLLHYWKNRGPIACDEARLLQIARLKATRAGREVLTTVLRFFEIRDGHIHHKRLDKELLISAENQAKQRERTAAATAARWHKKGMPTECVTESSSSLPPPLALTEDYNPNDLLFCCPVVEAMMGRKLHRTDQETVAVWCGEYDMHEALPLLEKQIAAYSRKHQGRTPPLSYFNPIFKQMLRNTP